MAEIEFIGGFGLETVGGEYFIVELDGSQQPFGTPLLITDTNGVAITSATPNIGSFKPIRVELDSVDGSTYVVLWKNDNGDFIQRNVDPVTGEWAAAPTVLTDAEVLALEDFFGGREVVEANGDVTLEANLLGEYVLVDNSVDPAVTHPVTFGGEPVSDTTFAGFTMIGAELGAEGGYTLLWDAPGEFAYTTWAVNGTGEFVSTNAAPDVFAAEVLFESDLNGDTIVGAPPVDPNVDVETAGDVTLQTNAAGEYILVDTSVDPAVVHPVTFGGEAVTGETFEGYTMIGAELGAEGGYTLLWDAPGEFAYTTWAVNGTGEFVSTNAAPDVFAAEVLFESDLNGDTIVGAPPVDPNVDVETAGDVTLQTNAAGEYILVDTSVDPAVVHPVTFGGEAVTGETFEGYTMIGAELGAEGGYTLLWDAPGEFAYTTWAVNGTGEFVSTNAAPDVFAAEVLFESDLNGDTIVGAPPVDPNVDVETAGDVTLQTNAAGEYILVDTSVDPAVVHPVTFGGEAVTGETFEGYTMIGAELGAEGGYTLLWDAPGEFAYTTWAVNGTGEFVSTNAAPDVFAAEVLFESDLNGDTIVGAPPVDPNVDVETAGDVTLQTNAAGEYILVDTSVDPAVVHPVTFGGEAVTGETFEGYTMIGAELGAEGGYTLLWDAPGEFAYTTWAVNGTGEFVSTNAAPDVFAAEVLFESDLNGDTIVGAPPVDPNVDVETAGDVTLQTNAAGEYILVDTSVDPAVVHPVTFGGEAVTGETFEGYTMIGAELGAEGGYTLLWDAPGEFAYTTWAVNGTGEFVSTNAAPDVFAAEVLFESDLNGDTIVGAPPVDPNVDVETNGVVTLQTNAAGEYILVDTSVDPAAVNAVTFGGEPVTGETFEGYTMIGAEPDGEGGYTLLWDAPGEGAYTSWAVDSMGEFIATDLNPDINALELPLLTDIDGDGFLFVENNGAIALKVDATTGQFIVDDGVTPIGIEDSPGVPSLLSDVSEGVISIQAEQLPDDSFVFLIESELGYELQTASAAGVLALGDPTPIADLDAQAVADTEILFDLDLDDSGFVGDLIA